MVRICFHLSGVLTNASQGIVSGDVVALTIKPCLLARCNMTVVYVATSADFSSPEQQLISFFKEDTNLLAQLSWRMAMMKSAVGET